MNRPAKFNNKAFFSFLTVIIWLVISLTGIVLYFAPPGRVANWVIWRFAFFTKAQWQAIHTIFAFLFILSGSFHLYFNWRIFWGYIRSRIQKGIKMGRELALASASVLIIFGLVMGEVPPIQTVVDWGEELKNSWSNEQTEPPVPHAEMLSLSEYAQRTGQDLQQVMNKLRNGGILGVDSLATLEVIGHLNNRSPQEIVQLISRTASSEISTISYAGYGRKTVPEICDELGIAYPTAIDRMNQFNLKYTNQAKLKEIAEINDLNPADVVNIITGKGEKVTK